MDFSGKYINEEGFIKELIQNNMNLINIKKELDYLLSNNNDKLISNITD